MRFSVRNVSMGLGAATVAMAALIAGGSTGLVAETGTPVEVAPALITPAWVADPAIAADETLLADTDVTFSSEAATPLAANTEVTALEPELECMAKVVRHEAANQSRKGQRAVAEIIMNRVRSDRFPNTVCGVVDQPGQFFDTASYNPSTSTRQWKLAVEVSREVLIGEGENVAEGAYFYHAAYQAPNRFFRGRQQIMALEDHIFYR